MVTEEYELIIVGAGVAGLSTALAAAKAGIRSILCLEQRGIANSYGASGDGLRLFRLSYFEHPAYVPLLRQAIESWRELGDSFYVPAGGLYAGPLDSELIQGSLESANMHNIARDIMPSSSAKAKYPQFELPPDYVVFVESEGGYIRAAAGTRALAEQAQHRDIEIRIGEVLQVTPRATRWRVECSDFQYIGTTVIVAAGNETSNLVPALRPHLTMETHLMLWLKEFDSIWEQSPGFGIMNADGEMLYGFPAVDDTPGVKIGGHHAFSSSSLEGQERRLRELAGQFLPSLSGEVQSRKTCQYDMSPDGHFIFGEVEPGLSVACGFSGHGFKFGPVLGELAWHAAIGDLPDELKFLSVKRLL